MKGILGRTFIINHLGRSFGFHRQVSDGIDPRDRSGNHSSVVCRIARNESPESWVSQVGNPMCRQGRLLDMASRTVAGTDPGHLGHAATFVPTSSTGTVGESRKHPSIGVGKSSSTHCSKSRNKSASLRHRCLRQVPPARPASELFRSRCRFRNSRSSTCCH